MTVAARSAILPFVLAVFSCLGCGGALHVYAVSNATSAQLLVNEMCANYTRLRSYRDVGTVWRLDAPAKAPATFRTLFIRPNKMYLDFHDEYGDHALSWDGQMARMNVFAHVHEGPIGQALSWFAGTTSIVPHLVPRMLLGSDRGICANGGSVVMLDDGPEAAMVEAQTTQGLVIKLWISKSSKTLRQWRVDDGPKGVRGIAATYDVQLNPDLQSEFSSAPAL
jgi:hypothetical protein